MKGHKSLTWPAAAVLITVAAGAPAQANAIADPAKATVKNIEACTGQNLVARGALRDLAVQVTDREGKQRSLRMRLFWKPTKAKDPRVNIRLVDPPAIAGSSYLLVMKGGSEQVYFALPGSNKPLHVTGKNMSEPLWGTDFSYGEIKQVLGLVTFASATRKADATVAGRTAFVIETLDSGEATGYQKVVSYVDQKACVLLKSEFFPKGDKPRKVLEADTSTLLQADVYWAVLGYTMRDLKQGSQTKLELTDLSFDERLPESLFTPERFFEPYQ